MTENTQTAAEKAAAEKAAAEAKAAADKAASEKAEADKVAAVAAAAAKDDEPEAEAELTADEIAALSPEDRQIRALKIERAGLVKRDLKDRVKEVDAQIKFYTKKANSNTASSKPLSTREA